MKKHLKLLAAIMIAAACAEVEPVPDQDPEQNQEQNQEQVTPPEEDDEEATPVEPSDFRAVLAEQATGIETTLSWKAGDAITFFWNGESSTVSIDEATDTVKFEQKVTAGTYYAVYPASAAKEQYGDAVMVDIPTVQSGTLENAFIWFAETDSLNRVFELRHLGSLGSITLGRSDIRKITISGNKDEGIAGTVYASIGEDGKPSCAEADATEIILEPAGGETFSPGTYYFIATPGSLSDGLSFTLETSGGNMMFGSAYPDEAKLERGTLMSFGTIDDISSADALRLRFNFGPDKGAKAGYDPEGNWPTDWVTNLNEGISYTYTLEGNDYSFYVKDQSNAGTKNFKWDTNNKDGYADRISIPSSTVYFGLPAIEDFKLTGVIVGQSRRGKTDNAATAVTKVGITNNIPEGAEGAVTYVSGGEGQEWHGWPDSDGKKAVVDHEFQLSGTQTNTVYYLNSDNSEIGLYFSRLVLTYEKQECSYKGFPENWPLEGEITGGEAGEGSTTNVDANADIRILFIGNSFTRDAVFHLPGMIKAAGTDKKILLVHMYYGGRTAQNYFNNWNKNRDFTCYVTLPGADSWITDKTAGTFTLAEMAARADWDLVVVQEHTGNQYSWYWTEDEKTALQGIIDYVKTAKSGNTPKVHYVMSQAYQNLEKAGSNQNFSNEAEMYTVITTQARKVMEETSFDGIISTGTMLQNLRTSSLNDDLHLTRDGFHMNLGISRYGAACTVFESIISPLTGKNLDGNTYRYAAEDDITIPVTDENAPIALEAARAAIEKPFEITTINQ